MTNIQGIMDIYRKISKINTLYFQSFSLSDSEMNWNHKGNGITKISIDYNKIFFLDTILLDNDIEYKDNKLWIFYDYYFEYHHFKNGSYEKLFEFTVENFNVKTKENYKCGNDLYFCDISFVNNTFFLTFIIQGPKKNEKIEYFYKN